MLTCRGRHSSGLFVISFICHCPRKRTGVALSINAVNLNYCAHFAFLSRAIDQTDSRRLASPLDKRSPRLDQVSVESHTALSASWPAEVSCSFFVFSLSFPALIEEICFASLLSLARHCLSLVAALLLPHCPAFLAKFLLFLLFLLVPPPFLLPLLFPFLLPLPPLFERPAALAAASTQTALRVCPVWTESAALGGAFPPRAKGRAYKQLYHTAKVS